MPCRGRVLQGQPGTDGPAHLAIPEPRAYPRRHPERMSADGLPPDADASPTLSAGVPIAPAATASARLGGFTLGPMLGRGATACVYAARDARLGRDVALKVLN